MSWMADTTCIFCQIVAGTAPASTFYEDEAILGFMNHKPVHPGECLLIPKRHINHFMDIDDALAARIMQLGQRLCRRIRAQLHPGRVGYVVAGYSVPHAHLLVLPSHHAHDITCALFAVHKAGDIVFTDEHIPLAPREELDRMASLLRLT
jgi:histidine triad (HIT) family protein